MKSKVLVIFSFCANSMWAVGCSKIGSHAYVAVFAFAPSPSFPVVADHDIFQAVFVRELIERFGLQ